MAPPLRRCALREASVSLASSSSAASDRPVWQGGLEGGLVGGDSSIAHVCAATGLSPGLKVVRLEWPAAGNSFGGDAATATAAGSAGIPVAAAARVSTIEVPISAMPGVSPGTATEYRISCRRSCISDTIAVDRACDACVPSEVHAIFACHHVSRRSALRRCLEFSSGSGGSDSAAPRPRCCPLSLPGAFGFVLACS